MYADFFGLRELPFNNTPDPRFFFSTPDHEEALASLIYAVSERKGFVLLTGEVGAGKTLVSRLMLRHFGTKICFATINHATTDPSDLMETILSEFELQHPEDATNAQMVRILHDYLLAQFAQNTPTVLVLDEAQSLPPAVFDQLRMIGNLEADDAKLLQIVILGQPELRTTFESRELRQLKQRIFRSFHLPQLSRKLAEGYIKHRLSVAGATDLSIFTTSAIDRIYEESQGLPRVINTICDNAMLSAYSADRHKIDGGFVDSVVDQMMTIGSPAGGEVPSMRSSTRVIASLSNAVREDRLRDRHCDDAYTEQDHDASPQVGRSSDYYTLASRLLMIEDRLDRVLFRRDITGGGGGGLGREQAADILATLRDLAGRVERMERSGVNHSDRGALRELRRELTGDITVLARRVDKIDRNGTNTVQRDELRAAQMEINARLSAMGERLASVDRPIDDLEKNLREGQELKAQLELMCRSAGESISEFVKVSADLNKREEQVKTLVEIARSMLGDTKKTLESLAVETKSSQKAQSRSKEITTNLAKQSERTGRLTAVLRRILDRIEERGEQAQQQERIIKEKAALQQEVVLPVGPPRRTGRVERLAHLIDSSKESLTDLRELIRETSQVRESDQNLSAARAIANTPPTNRLAKRVQSLVDLVETRS